MIVFYHTEIAQPTVVLTPEESKHCVKVLRKKVGDIIFLTDGNGIMAEAEITVATPMQCVAQILRREEVAARNIRLHIAVAPTKNMDRMEWFVEKSVEIGIEEISFIICEHSERSKVDLERIQRIAISALKQSQTALLPKIQVVNYEDFIQRTSKIERCKYIAWCDQKNSEEFVNEKLTDGEVLMLIGPEGDFSENEISLARSLGFKEIKLGNRRLRTETAALYSCCVVAMKNTIMG